MALQTFLDFEIEAHHRQTEASRDAARRSAFNEARRAQRTWQHPSTGVPTVATADTAPTPRRLPFAALLRVRPLARLGRPTA